MVDDSLVNDIKNIQRLSDNRKRNVDKFIEGVLDVTLNFIGENSSTLVGGYEIIKKHPWFLNKHDYGDEVIIRTSKKDIINWLNYSPRNWLQDYHVINFDNNDIDYIKDYLSQLRSLLDIDLLDTQFDQLQDIKDIESIKNNKRF